MNVNLLPFHNMTDAENGYQPRRNKKAVHPYITKFHNFSLMTAIAVVFKVNLVVELVNNITYKKIV